MLTLRYACLRVQAGQRSAVLSSAAKLLLGVITDSADSPASALPPLSEAWQSSALLSPGRRDLHQRPHNSSRTGLTGRSHTLMKVLLFLPILSDKRGTKRTLCWKVRVNINASALADTSHKAIAWTNSSATTWHFLIVLLHLSQLWFLSFVGSVNEVSWIQILTVDIWVKVCVWGVLMKLSGSTSVLLRQCKNPLQVPHLNIFFRKMFQKYRESYHTLCSKITVFIIIICQYGGTALCLCNSFFFLFLKFVLRDFTHVNLN